MRNIYSHQYKLSEGTLLSLLPLHNTKGIDFFSVRNYYKDAAETFPIELPWLTSKLLQLCFFKSFLPLSLGGNLSVTPVKHQLQIYERLHATSSVRSNETSSNLACFILLQLGNILSNIEGQNLFTRRAKTMVQEGQSSNQFPQEPCFPWRSRVTWNRDNLK